ncbi:class A beta-lactamase-related serine hydrolase [Labedella populi]|uniref:Class A beta-lactamase-related serine hydrolase n=1 Tax=Labedella populi TaxID=2498850 RepID=A0A444Q6F4_9MICO|nr:serine hydrolase domain-containing protein [Labedella populi]RWZ59486.1 class A beta-lactamase-related serine hydrolase [Labedella populi]
MSDTTVPAKARARGHVEPAFERVRDEFERMLGVDPGYGAQVTAIWRGRTVVDLVGGRGTESDSITGVFSVTKGIAATVVGLLVTRGQLRLDAAVAEYWPEFGAAGKAAITVREALSHRAGIVGVPERFTVDELVDSSLAAAKIAAHPPLWQPGSAHGYHAITIGVLMEELVRRVSGRSLQSIYESEIRAPREIDFHLGVPSSEEYRYRAALPAVVPPDAEVPPPPSSDGLQALAFNVLHSSLPPTAGEMGPNNRAVRAAGIASIGGVGSARGLAAVYAAVLGDDSTAPLLSTETIAEMSRQHAFGLDRVLGFTTSFGIGFMKPHPAMDFGSYRAFGHDGAGGALAFADPLHDLAFGYIPTPMQLPGGADPKAITLSQTIRSCVRDV